MHLVRGQKTKLSDLTTSTQVQIALSITSSTQDVYDISCFGLDENGKLSDERYFIFYNQPLSPEGAIRKDSLGKNQEQFTLQLEKLPSSIRRLVFTINIDGPGVMSQITSGQLRLQQGAQTVATFDFSGPDFGQEKALIAGELYWKDQWRVAAVGQGFSGGLGALLRSFGGEEAADPPAPQPPPQPPAPPAKVNLTKITLEKRGDSQRVELRKTAAVQPIHINLNWDQQSKKAGLLGSLSGQSDLDLGCMLEMMDGSKLVIQALGQNFGEKDEPPYVLLDKDDRTGADSAGENLYIYRPDLIKRLLVFCFIYQGSSNFTDVNGRVLIKDAAGNEITIRLDSPDPEKTLCAICLLENAGSHLNITKEELYFRSHREADKHFQFGFRWTKASKD